MKGQSAKEQWKDSERAVGERTVEGQWAAEGAQCKTVAHSSRSTSDGAAAATSSFASSSPPTARRPPPPPPELNTIRGDPGRSCGAQQPTYSQSEVIRPRHFGGQPMFAAWTAVRSPPPPPPPRSASSAGSARCCLAPLRLHRVRHGQLFAQLFAQRRI